MNQNQKEGAPRPLSFAVPVLGQNAAWVWAALGMYPLAYGYVRGILFSSGVYGSFALPAFAALFMLGVEALARAEHRAPAKETPLWAVCWLALSVAMPLWGWQETLGEYQPLAWHLFAVWYVLARCSVLAQGFSGSLCFLDALAGLFRLPFGNFGARAKTILCAVRGGAERRAWLRRAAAAIGTLALAGALCLAAWSLLAAADANFARLGSGALRLVTALLNAESLVNFAVYFALSLPVGAWLFGLVFGALHRDAAPCTAAQFAAKAAPLRVLPAACAGVIVGALCAVYALFFAVQAAEWCAAAPFGLSAPAAADFAADGFWELLEILLLDLAVLAGVRFLARAPLPKALAALFCAFGLAFAGLSAAKLAVYINLYGYTPRRTVAGWFLAVLAVWAVLLLVRVFYPLPAARIGLAVLVASFTLLSCIDLNSRIVYANLDRYAAGQDAELDTSVLRRCGFDGDTAALCGSKVTAYTRRLLETNWLKGRDRTEISGLYGAIFSDAEYESLPLGGLSAGDGIYTLHLDGAHTLFLLFENGKCTEVSLDTALDRTSADG